MNAVAHDFRRQRREYGELVPAAEMQAHLHDGWRLLDDDPSLGDFALMARPASGGEADNAA